MRKKSICLLVLILMLLSFSSTTFAGNANFSFNLARGAASSYTALNKKSDNERTAYVTVQGGNQVQGVEIVNYRVRNSSGGEASFLLQTSKYGRYSLQYKGGQGFKGQSYRLYSNLPSSNPYSNCTVYGVWCP